MHALQAGLGGPDQRTDCRDRRPTQEGRRDREGGCPARSLEGHRRLDGDATGGPLVGCGHEASLDEPEDHALAGPGEEIEVVPAAQRANARAAADAAELGGEAQDPGPSRAMTSRSTSGLRPRPSSP